MTDKERAPMLTAIIDFYRIFPLGSVHRPIKRIVVDKIVFRNLVYEAQEILKDGPNFYVQSVDYQHRRVQICGIAVEPDEY